MHNQVLAPSSGLLSARLHELMKKKGYNITKLAQETGTGLATINRILSDSNCNPTYLTLKAIADVFGVSIGELLGETESKLKMQHKVKLIEWEDVLSFLEAGCCEEIKDNCEFTSSNVSVSKKSFALKLPISHMFPVFHENSILIFDPSKKPYDRAYVLVKLIDHPKVILKQLIKDEPFYYIKSINPILTESIAELKKNDKILATLVQSVINH